MSLLLEYITHIRLEFVIDVQSDQTFYTFLNHLFIYFYWWEDDFWTVTPV